jgi:hypothetical protein
MDEPGNPCKSAAVHSVEDQPAGEEIQRGNEYRVGPERVDRSTLELAEELGRRFKVDEGIGIIELSFQGGRFEHAWLKRRVQKAQLADAD